MDTRKTVAAVAVDHSDVAMFVCHVTVLVRAVALVDSSAQVPASNTVIWIRVVDQHEVR